MADITEDINAEEQHGNSKKIVGKPFPPGVSGNPGGRPKGSISLVNMMRERHKMIGPDQKRSIAEHLIDNIMQDALDGKDTQLKLLLNYVEGMPRQSLDIGNDGELPFLITVVKDEPKREDNPPILPAV